MRKVTPRAVAKALGLTRYFSGKPCPQGHIAERLVSTMGCRVCALQTKLAWEKKRSDARQAAIAERKAKRYSPAGVEAAKLRKKAVAAARYQANRAHARKLSDAWYAANKERKAVAAAAWHAANKQSVSDRHIAWADANPERRRAAKLRRRAREADAGGKVSADDLRNLFAAQKGKCVYCKAPLGKGHHADHILPLSLGGHGGVSNIQLTCKSCNLHKSYLHPIDFARRRGMLL